MLTGEKPLGAFKRPSELNPQLPSDADSILMRALSRDPDDRFVGVCDLLSALKKSLASSISPLQRNLMAAISITAVVTALLTFAITTYQTPQRAAIVSSNADLAGQQSDGTTMVAHESTEAASNTNLDSMTVAELRDFARDQGLTGYSGLSRSALEELIKAGGRRIELPPGWTTEIRIDRAGRRYRWYISPDGKSYRSPPNGAGIVSGEPAADSG